MKKFSLSYFWVGVVARLAVAPFLLRWYHPDERQLLEFSHFQAHLRLHPFMESLLHLRNQTLPWLFSFIIRFCDGMGLNEPRAYLFSFHLLIGMVSWLSFCGLIETLKESRAKTCFAWFLALFWAFPFLYSRGLLEAISLPSTLLLLVALKNRKFLWGGFLAGLTAILRYPSALFTVGAVLWVIADVIRTEKPMREGLKILLPAFCGFLMAVSLGGLVDLHVYGKFLDSAWSYWRFNRPGGPVHEFFGDDSLIVYWRWFQYLFSPWVAALFLFGSFFSLYKNPKLLLFCLPYLIGHIWTPHREPRFMLPLTPIFALAITEAWIDGGFSKLQAFWMKFSPRLKKTLYGVMTLHVGLNFLVYPLLAFAQWESSQSILLRSFQEMSQVPTELMNYSDPVIDALVPVNARWADSECRWHRPPIEGSRLWVLKEDQPASACKPIRESKHSAFFQKIFRVRTASLWECPDETKRILCPQGMKEAPLDEPLISATAQLKSFE